MGGRLLNPPIVRCVESFPSDRKAAVKVDDFIGPSESIFIGIHQGSPVSPILSVLYSADVIKEIRDDPSLVTSSNIPLLPLSYVDDFALLWRRTTLSSESATLDRAFSLLYP